MSYVIYRFGDCELDSGQFELRRNGVAQKIEPQVFEVLAYLVQRAGQFVGKDELHRVIWQQRVVSDAAVSSRIKAARRAIGDDGAAQRCIRTVHGRGFTFVAPVVLVEHPGRVADRHPDTASAPPPGKSNADANARPVLLSADVHLIAILSGDGVPAAADEQIMEQRALLEAQIGKAGGSVLGRTGGGITARFSTAIDALACAGSIQERHSPGPQAPGGERMAVRPRIGIADLGERAEAAGAMAARLQCVAAPGEICLPSPIADRANEILGFSTRPVDGELGNELKRLGVCIVQPVDVGSDPMAPGIAQLRCGSPMPPREPSIVLLPFEALGSDERTSELAEGLRIDIQNGLVKIGRILLIAAASANAFRGQSPERAARALGVRYVLHAVVRMHEDRARIFVELVDAQCANPVWAEQFEITITDTFSVQDEITRKVLTALDVNLFDGEQARIWHQVLTEPKAVRTFYRGIRMFFRMDRESMVEARRAFESVAELKADSSIGPTWTALTHWIEYMRHWGASPGDSKRLAKRWAEAAAGLPDADGQADTVLAHIRLLDREFEAALEAGRRALELRPGCANANGFFGNVLHYCGDQGGAIRHLRKGIRLQPVYPPFFASILATAYFGAGQPEASALVAKEALRLNGRDIQSRLVLVAACHGAGHIDLARLFAAEVMQLEPGLSVAGHCRDQPYRRPDTLAAFTSAWLDSGLPP